MDIKFTTEFEILYLSYLNIKPLIAEIEVRYEKFPTPILNEIRAFNDHIAQCYLEDMSSDKIEHEIKRAGGHIERVALDCYKFLNVEFHKNTIRRFNRRTKGIDLHAINNGEFVKEYYSQKKLIEVNLKEAKLQESNNKEKALKLYELVYNTYSSLETLLIDNDKQICWARARFYTSKILKFFGWLIAAIISGILSSALIPWNCIWNSILGWFN